MSATPQTLFIGGKVFDGRGQVLPNHGVLVEGKRVTRVAPAGEFAGFAGRRVDTGGMTLMPGMADCHVHLVYTGGADPQTQMSKQGPAQITQLTALENAQGRAARRLHGAARLRRQGLPGIRRARRHRARRVPGPHHQGLGPHHLHDGRPRQPHRPRRRRL